MLIRVTGIDGTDAFIDAQDVRVVMPGQEDSPKAKLPTEENGLPIIRPKEDKPEIAVSIVAFKTPGAQAIVIAEAPKQLTARINAARTGTEVH